MNDINTGYRGFHPYNDGDRVEATETQRVDEFPYGTRTSDLGEFVGRVSTSAEALESAPDAPDVMIGSGEPGYIPVRPAAEPPTEGYAERGAV